MHPEVPIRWCSLEGKRFIKLLGTLLRIRIIEKETSRADVRSTWPITWDALKKWDETIKLTWLAGPQSTVCFWKQPSSSCWAMAKLIRVHVKKHLVVHKWEYMQVVEGNMINIFNICIIYLYTVYLCVCVSIGSLHCSLMVWVPCISNL